MNLSGRLHALAGEFRVTSAADLMALVAVAVALVQFIHWGLFWSMNGEAVDFRCYYFGARMARDHVNPYLHDPETHRFYYGDYEGPQLFPYPPPSLLLFVPLSFLPLKAACYAWAALNLWVLGVALRTALRLAGNEAAIRSTIIFAFLIFPPVAYTLALGQLNLWILLCVLLVACRLEEGRPMAAGVLLGLGIVLKLTPLIFTLYLIARRQWLALGSCLACCLGLAIATQLLFPSASWASCLTVLHSFGLKYNEMGGWAFGNQSPYSLTGSLLSATGTWQHMLPGLCLVVLTVAIWSSNRWSGSPHGTLLEIGLGALTMILASPLSEVHHYVVVLVAVTGLLGAWQQLPGRPWTLAAVALAIGILAHNFNTDNPRPGLSRLLQILMGYPLVWATLLLWGTLAWILSRRPPVEIEVRPA